MKTNSTLIAVRVELVQVHENHAKHFLTVSRYKYNMAITYPFCNAGSENKRSEDSRQTFPKNVSLSHAYHPPSVDEHQVTTILHLYTPSVDS